jgi:hypothetical protein
MRMCTDQEIVQMVGNVDKIMSMFSASLGKNNSWIWFGLIGFGLLLVRMRANNKIVQMVGIEDNIMIMFSASLGKNQQLGLVWFELIGFGGLLRMRTDQEIVKNEDGGHRGQGYGLFYASLGKRTSIGF